jgi:integrase/recombinase XerD
MTHLHLVESSNLRLIESFEEFVISKQAQMRSERTITNYRRFIGRFLDWLGEEGITEPQGITSQVARRYIAGLVGRGLQPSTVATHARYIRVFTNFLFEEGIVEKEIRIKPPKVPEKRQRVLSKPDLKRLIFACEKPRDTALLLVAVDTGLRRSELANLEWRDVDLSAGVVRVRAEGAKNRRFRTTVIGRKTRAALAKHRRTIEHEPSDSVFGLGGSGIRMLLRRLGERTGVEVSCHDLRRTFATWSLRNGMSPLHLQSLMGHSSLEMVRKYIQLVDDDLRQAHQAASPIDRL